MATDFEITDIATALAGRHRPTAVTFNRLEGRPRNEEFGRSLRAEVRDAVWFLSRQWQVAEFEAEDAGSPVTARLHAESSAVQRVSVPGGPPRPYDPNIPLEADINRRPIVLSNDLRLLAGRRWLKLLASVGDYADSFIAAYPFASVQRDAAADASTTAHVEAWQMASALAGQAVDGGRFLHAWRTMGSAALDTVGISSVDRPAVEALAVRFDQWFRSMFLQPDEGADAWQPAALEYACSVEVGDSRSSVLTGDGQTGGPLDWYDLDLDPEPSVLGDAPTLPRVVRRTLLPTAVTFAGMPNARWWSLEDGQTDLGAQRIDTTDVGRLLVTEFALAYSNDWLLMPLTVPDGRLDVRALVVTDTFGDRYWIDPAGEGRDDDWQRWGLYGAAIRHGDGPADTGVLLLPTVDHVQQGPVQEEVAFVRDEMANIVWGIELRVRMSDGRSVPGSQAAGETRRHFERLAGLAPVPQPDPVAPIRYRVMSSMPEHWIPFVAVHTPGSDRDVQLQRAAMPRLIEGGPTTPDRVRPRTEFLRTGLDAGQPYFVREEEVPRSGVRLSSRFHRARWTDGRVVTWLGSAVHVGRGEAASGLRFDQADATHPAP